MRSINKIKEDFSKNFSFYLQKIKVETDRILDYFIDIIKPFVKRIKNFERTNTELASYHLNKANLFDVKFRIALVLKFFPDNKECLYSLARLNIYRHKFEDALSILGQLTEKKPNFHKALNRLELLNGKSDLVNNDVVLEDRTYLSNFYEEMKKDTGNESFSKLGDFILDYLDSLKFDSLTLLEIGCNNGNLSRKLKERFDKLEIYGLENVKNHLDYIKDKNKPYERLIEKNLDFDLSDLDKKFDIIFSDNCLSYEVDIVKKIEYLGRYLKKDGKIIFTIFLSDSNYTKYNCEYLHFFYTESIFKKVKNCEIMKFEIDNKCNGAIVVCGIN